MLGASPLQLFFVRSGTTPDDILRITPSKVSARFYNMSYTDNNSVVKCEYTATESEIFDYIDSMFVLMQHDEDPFVQLQLQSPIFPSILLDVKSMADSTIQDAFYTVVRNTLRNWPTTVRHPLREAQIAAAAAAAAEETEEDEDIDAEETEEDAVVENNNNINRNNINYTNPWNTIPHTYANWTNTYAPTH